MRYTALILIGLAILLASCQPAGKPSDPPTRIPLADEIEQIEIEGRYDTTTNADGIDETTISVLLGVDSCLTNGDPEYEGNCDRVEIECTSGDTIDCNDCRNNNDVCELEWVDAMRSASTGGYSSGSDRCVQSGDMSTASSSCYCNGCPSGQTCTINGCVTGTTSPGTSPDPPGSTCNPCDPADYPGEPYCDTSGNERRAICDSGCLDNELTGNTCTIAGDCTCSFQSYPGEYQVLSETCGTGYSPTCNQNTGTCSCII